ncbi:MAG: methyltransferase [Deltaproteobacteria bacterium]|nr:methyltransferase [Deltaproteobacteria bacterium]
MDPVPGPHETCDILSGTWRILQLRRGHRFSTDDLLCAWAAARDLARGPHRLLDLGAGIGSVGLMVLWKVGQGSRLVMVEAQAESHQLAVRTVALNDLADRVEARWGDLRDPASVPEEQSYDVVTCSPPYIPPGRGVLSPVAQRAGARIELRGDIFDYLGAARRAVAPQGRVAVVFAAGDPRLEAAVAAADLAPLWRRDVVFRAGKPPSICVLVAVRAEEGPMEARRESPLVLRDAAGIWTEEYVAVRRATGAPVPG